MVGPRERAEILLGKAAQDEFTIRKLLTDPESPGEVIGFHAQQALEKMLKAVLSFKSIHYRRTHDLVELIDLLRENGVAFPEELEDGRRLAPFAVEFRYDEMPAEPERPFDRSAAWRQVQKMREWAESILREQSA